MSIQCMACPKCGKKSTEYDEGKWQCLYCGIKFIEKTDCTTITNNNQQIITLNFDCLYDIDMKNKREHEAEEYIEEHKPEIVNHFVIHAILLIASSILLCCGISFLLNSSSPGSPYSYDCRVLVLTLTSLMGIALLGFLYSIFANTPIKNIIKRYYIYRTCPYCNDRVMIGYFNKPEAILNSSIRHCLKCGKQIIVTKDYSYGIRK